MYGELLRRHIQAAESADGWTRDHGVLQHLWYTGAALPNDDEIIQLTEGGKLEEQQEPKLTTPEIPRELIGYEWTYRFRWRRLTIAYQAKKLLMRTIKQWHSQDLPGWAAHPEDQNEEENK